MIIGGGVVGCAGARAYSTKWDDVFLLEALPKLGMGASSRNSGVIHSGLYYPPGSLKARHCVRGNRLTPRILRFTWCSSPEYWKVGRRLVCRRSRGTPGPCRDWTCEWSGGSSDNRPRRYSR